MTRPLAALLAGALLAACGGGGDNEPDGGPEGPAPRVVEVKALDTLRFDPATIAAKAGEKIEFRVTNSGAQQHELVIGDAAYHDAHEKAAAASPSGGHDGHAAGNGAAVVVGPGETRTLGYVMPATPPTYACHIASHDDAGMKGTVTY